MIFNVAVCVCVCALLMRSFHLHAEPSIQRKFTCGLGSVWREELESASLMASWTHLSTLIERAWASPTLVYSIENFVCVCMRTYMKFTYCISFASMIQYNIRKFFSSHTAYPWFSIQRSKLLSSGHAVFAPAWLRKTSWSARKGNYQCHYAAVWERGHASVMTTVQVANKLHEGRARASHSLHVASLQTIDKPHCNGRGLCRVTTRSTLLGPLQPSWKHKASTGGKRQRNRQIVILLKIFGMNSRNFYAEKSSLLTRKNWWRESVNFGMLSTWRSVRSTSVIFSKSFQRLSNLKGRQQDINNIVIGCDTALYIFVALYNSVPCYTFFPSSTHCRRVYWWVWLHG